MRLLNVYNWKFEDVLDERRLPKYAILSHTWGLREVQYRHMLDLGRYLENEKLDFYKIRFLCKQAIRDGFKYAWIDTCCIDKESSAELSEAINSMYRWYQKSAVCYVYMSDITLPDHWEAKSLLGGSTYYIDHTNKVMSWQHPALSHHIGAGGKAVGSDRCSSFEPENRVVGEESIYSCNVPSVKNNVLVDSLGAAAPAKHFVQSRWFTRGWTLQELIAPGLLRFYDANGLELGSQRDVIHFIDRATGIPIDVLHHETEVDHCSIAMRMSWASKRETTRIEDEAYCLLGIFDVNMPLLYGEGAKAFTRLQEEIIKVSDDQSILAWDRGSGANEILAPSVLHFQQCGKIGRLLWPSSTRTHKMTKRGLEIQLRGCYIGTKQAWKESYRYTTRICTNVVVLLLNCFNGRKPGHYIAIKLWVEPRWRSKETTLDIYLRKHTMVYIPYHQRVWPLRSGTRDCAVGDSCRKDFILLRPSESRDSTLARRIPVTVDVAYIDSARNLEGYPTTAWDTTYGERGKYSCNLIEELSTKFLFITVDRGDTLVLALFSYSVTVRWRAMLCAGHGASKKITSYINEIRKRAKSRKRTNFRHLGRVSLYTRVPEYDSLRLSNTKKLYVQIDPASDRTDMGIYMTLQIKSSTG